jgi:hypothetical protein
VEGGMAIFTSSHGSRQSGRRRLHLLLLKALYEVPFVVTKLVCDISGWPLHANIGWRCPPSGCFRSKLLETGSKSRVTINLLSHHGLGRRVMATIGRKPVIDRSKADRCLLWETEDISENMK